MKKNIKAMKKNCVLLLLAIVSTNCLVAQEADSIMQPIRVVGKRINASGEVTRAYDADFEYDAEGKLQGFSFPDCGLNTALTYENGELKEWRTLQPDYTAGLVFLGVVNFTRDDMGRPNGYYGYTGTVTNEEETFYCSYEYDGQGRIDRKEKGDWLIQHTNVTCRSYWLYDYEDEGRTRIESEYRQAWHNGQLAFLLSKESTCQYSGEYALMSVRTDSYDDEGGIVESTLRTYDYTGNGKIESETIRMLAEGEWVNASIIEYTYDANGCLAERRTGVWSEEGGGWDYTEKIVYEHDRLTEICTVSFYKKSDGEWVRDVYDYNATVFFDGNLTLQEECLKQMSFESMYGYHEATQINQFEVTMQYMKGSALVSEEQGGDVGFGIFPNPGRDEVTIKAPCENMVVRFYDMQGRTVFAKPFDFDVSVGTGSWAPGIYLWEIWSGTEKGASGKWIKE